MHVRCPTCNAITGILEGAGLPASIAGPIGAEVGGRIEKKVKKKLNKWTRHLKNFKWRARRKKESPKKYLSARTVAASKSYRKKNKKRRK